MNADQHNNPQLPDNLHELEQSLDALGEHTRRSAPDGLGDRIAAASMGALRNAEPGLRLSGSDAEPRLRIGAPWKLAASLALLIVAAFVVIALNQRGGQPAQPDADLASTAFIDDLIEIETEYAADSGWDSDTFASLQSELTALESSLNEPWDLDESLLFNDGESL